MKSFEVALTLAVAARAISLEYEMGEAQPLSNDL